MCLPSSEYAAATRTRLSHLNVGVGSDLSIAELADMVRNVVGYDGEVVYNASYPDGTMRKLLDVSKLSELGWKAEIDLESGIKDTYGWYQSQKSEKSACQ